MLTKVLNEAAKWVGYLEKKSNAQLEDFTANAGDKNYTIFAKWYTEWWSPNYNYQAQAWCAMFVSCVFRLALGQELFPPFAYCPTGVNNFKAKGQWFTSNPKPGDVIFYKDNSGVACHVGLVEKVEGGKVCTIEGNTSSAAGVVANGGCVARKSYALTYDKIMGYGRPKYASAELTTVNDIVWELSHRGILSDKELWLKKLDEDSNAYWLARKTVAFLQSKGV